MKKFLLSSAIACFLVIAAATSALAQNPSKKEVAKLDFPPTVSKSSSTLTEDNMTIVNSRAIKDFKKTFKFSTNEKWYNLDNGFLVKFTQDEINHRVDYDKKGNWISTFRYYEEKQLPKDIRRQVKSAYYDYNITSVQEILVDKHQVYLINMEDEKTILIIRICDGDMDVYKELRKTEGPKN